MGNNDLSPSGAGASPFVTRKIFMGFFQIHSAPKALTGMGNQARLNAHHRR